MKQLTSYTLEELEQIIHEEMENGKYGSEDIRIISMFYCRTCIEHYMQQGINLIFL